jgi:uncharacterized membrane protein YgdD (TMEM256/DUF423 family)
MTGGVWTSASAWLAIGSVLGALGVGLGAFGAHGLKGRVDPGLLAVFETAVRYHLVHALAIVAVAWASERWPGPWSTAAGWLFLAGIGIFCGSLYLMVPTGARWLGAITPIGGLALIAGWCALAIAAIRRS